MNNKRIGKGAHQRTNDHADNRRNKTKNKIKGVGSEKTTRSVGRRAWQTWAAVRNEGVVAGGIGTPAGPPPLVTVVPSVKVNPFDSGSTA